MKSKNQKRQKHDKDEKDFKFIKGLNIEVHGKLGKKIYSVSKLGKPFSRKMPKKKYRPVTPAQREVRDIINFLNEQWKLLSAAEREEWNKAVAFRARRVNPETRSRALIRIPSAVISGNNFFVEVNYLARSLPCRQAGVGQAEIIKSPPVDMLHHRSLPVPAKPRITEVKFDDGALTIFWSEAATTRPDDFARIWMASKEKKFFKQLAGVGLASAGQMAIKEVKKGRQGILDVSELAGTTVRIQADVVNRATGLASDPSNTVEFVLNA